MDGAAAAVLDRSAGWAVAGSPAGDRGDRLEYRTGSSWREVPEEQFGPWQTAYERLTRRSADGTWAKLLARAQSDLTWLTSKIESMPRRVDLR